jgi:hypothetical protein
VALERGGTCLLLQLSSMGTQRGQMIGVLPLLLRWTRHAGTCRFLSCLGCSSQPSIQYYFPRRTLFHCLSRHRPATWAVRRAGPPISVSQLLFYIPSPKLDSSLHFQSSNAFTEPDNLFCDLYCCKSTLELYCYTNRIFIAVKILR